MNLINTFRVVAAAALVTGVMAGSSAMAGTVPDVDAASYQGLYDPISVKSGSNLHAFWMPTQVSSQRHYQFDPNSHAKFDWLTSATQATLKGTIVNNSNANQRFEVDVTFDIITGAGYTNGRNPARPPKCEFTGGANGCGNAAYDNGVDGTSDRFEYFTVNTSSKLTGLGEFAGVEIGIAQFPTNGQYPMQLGFGANNKAGGGNILSQYNNNPGVDDPETAIDETARRNIDIFGLSTWLYLTLDADDNDVFLSSLGAATGQRIGDHADINLELDYPVPVPVPAALPLFGSGLALLGFMGWRRKRQDAGAMAA